MIDLLFSIFKGLFKEQLKVENYNAVLKYEKAKVTNHNQRSFPIGSKVMLQKEGPFPLIIGEVKEHHLNTELNKMYCVIEDSSGVKYEAVTNIIDWTSNRETFLKKLRWHQRLTTINTSCNYSDEDAEKIEKEFSLQEKEFFY